MMHMSRSNEEIDCHSVSQKKDLEISHRRYVERFSIDSTCFWCYDLASVLTHCGVLTSLAEHQRCTSEIRVWSSCINGRQCKIIGKGFCYLDNLTKARDSHSEHAKREESWRDHWGEEERWDLWLEGSNWKRWDGGELVDLGIRSVWDESLCARNWASKSLVNILPISLSLDLIWNDGVADTMENTCRMDGWIASCKLLRDLRSRRLDMMNSEWHQVEMSPVQRVRVTRYIPNLKKRPI